MVDPRLKMEPPQNCRHVAPWIPDVGDQNNGAFHRTFYIIQLIFPYVNKKLLHPLRCFLYYPAVTAPKTAAPTADALAVEEVFLFQICPHKLAWVAEFFECSGGKFRETVIHQAIDLISRNGKLLLLGVSEDHVPINTRDVLAKGIHIFAAQEVPFLNLGAFRILQSESIAKKLWSN